jgi:hypothetical protein
LDLFIKFFLHCSLFWRDLGMLKLLTLLATIFWDCLLELMFANSHSKHFFSMILLILWSACTFL